MVCLLGFSCLTGHDPGRMRDASKILSLELGDIGGPRQSPYALLFRTNTRSSQLIRVSRKFYHSSSERSADRGKVHTHCFSQLIRVARNLYACLENSITRARRHRRIPEKCEFFKKEVCYLGYIISKHGIKPDPKKVEAMTNFPTPQQVKNIFGTIELL